LSAPKKGKDLSALKARLAKKAGKADAPVPAPGEAAEAPAGDVPAPGEILAEPAPADVPAPGEVSVPADIPAPGEVAAPVEEAPQAAPAAEQGGALDGGGYSPNFDPNAGVIADSGGDIAPKSSKGLVAVAAAAAMLVGAAAGYLLSKKSYNEDVVASASRKGPEIYGELVKIKDTRAKISLRMGDIKKSVDADGKKGADELTALVTENFKDYPQANKLFGYELAAMPEGHVKKLFTLYEHSNGLVVDMGTWAAFVNENAKILGAGNGGPRAYAVTQGKGGMVLVGMVDLACGKTEDGKPVACEKDKSAAEFVVIQRQLGGPTEVLPRAEAPMLLADGPIFKYAIGEKPERNALEENARLVRRIEGRLEAMNAAEKAAFKAFEKFEGAAVTTGGGDAKAEAAPAE
jgi:hypothetical protein